MKRMRKLQLLLVALVFATMVAPAAAYADPPTGGSCNGIPDGHDWDLVYEYDATCTSIGYETWQCKNCGEIYTENPPALGHSWSYGWTSAEATCTEYGTDVYVCDRCDETYTEYTYPLGHDWQSTVTKQATCTEDGIITYTCSRCGDWWTESIDAYGHDWDDGVTTEPQGLTDGQTVTTCKRCGETEVEVIPAAPALFTALRGFPPGMIWDSETDFRITKHPASGYISRDGNEKYTLTVAVEGGVAPYTFMWHCESLEPQEPSVALTASMINAADLLNSHYQSASADWAKAVVSTYEEKNNADLVEAIQELLSGGSMLGGLDPENPTATESSESTYTATLGNCSCWCEITDAEGHVLISDAARVRYHVRFVEQPNNVNLQTEEQPVMTCQAADGAGLMTYTYSWYDADFNLVGEGKTFEPPAEGEYFCIVSDGEDSATSAIATAYRADPFMFMGYNAGTKLWPEEEWELCAWCRGGVEPYEVWWDKDGVPLLTEQGESVNGYPAFYAVGVGEGKYTVHATDDKGVEITAVTYRADKHLTVAKQPESGRIPSKGDSLPLSVQMADGQAPLTYDFYFNDQLISSAEVNGFDSGVFRAYEAGVYRFVITDALGHTGKSDGAYIEAPKFRIASQTEEATVKYPNGTVLLKAEAEGGKAPYKYYWLIRHGASWYRIGSEGSMYHARVGDYICLVEDDEGETIRSKPIPVTYGGVDPMIVVQPKDKKLPYRDDGKYEFSLTCEAISGTGDDDNLRYQWYIWDNAEGWCRYNFGSTMKGYECGLFMCEVTDKSNHVSVDSNVALVYPELTIVQAEIYARIDNSNAEYHLHYVGGIESPYTVEVYLKGNDTTPDILVDTQRFAGTFPKFYLPLWRELVYTENGVTKQKTAKAEYYFVVTDAGGATDTSKLVTWGN